LRTSCEHHRQTGFFIEVNKVRKKEKLVCGVGINDADYVTYKIIDGKRWRCPFYRAWMNMLDRCYSPKHHARRPNYIGCSVVHEWHYFMAFRAWMISQDWNGKQLDKDILTPGNKVYGPETCLFVSIQINSLLNDHAASKGDYPQGVHWDNQCKKYRARIRIFGKTKHLGYFATADAASIAYRKTKHAHILHVVSAEQDIRVRQGLARHAALFDDSNALRPTR